jgi:hypothetical protein
MRLIFSFLLFYSLRFIGSCTEIVLEPARFQRTQADLTDSFHPFNTSEFSPEDRNRKLDISFSNAIPSYQGFHVATTSSIANFGSSVARGDVNGDGFRDLIIGASNYNSGDGMVVIAFGSASLTNIESTANLVTFYGKNEYAGTSVARVGDLNGDGYIDFVIGSNGYHTNAGRVHFIYGSPNFPKSNSLNRLGSLGVTFSNTVDNEFCGTPTASGGDINGDTKNDIVIGCYGYNNYAGKVYVVFGKVEMKNITLPTISSQDGFQIIGNTGQGTLFGVSVSIVGDVNMDGVADFVIGNFVSSFFSVVLLLILNFVFILFLAAGASEWTTKGRVFLIYGVNGLNNVDMNSFYGQTWQGLAGKDSSQIHRFSLFILCV